MSNFKFDADEILRDEVVLDKIDVVRRQLNTAIKMFFFEWDVVSLHTIAGAAHAVIRDVAKHRGFSKSFKDSHLIAPESKREYLRAVNCPQNFFKHANSDPNGRMAFRYNGTPFFVLDAINIYSDLGHSISKEMKIFLMWTQLRYPDLLCLDSAEIDLKKIRDTTKNATTFLALGRALLLEKDQLAQ